MEVKFDLTRELAAAKKDAETLLRERVGRAGKAYVDTLLRDNSFYGQPSGVVYDMIKVKVDDYVTSQAFSDAMDKAIAEVIEEQAREALKIVLGSATRKHLFQATDPRAALMAARVAVQEPAG